MAHANTAGQLGWLLDNLAGRVEHVRQAVVLSRDGLGWRRLRAEHEP